MEVRPVDVADVLRARDARVQLQQEMLGRRAVPLICLTMNIAGEIKRDEWIERAFREGVQRVEKQLAWHGVSVLERRETISFTGCEAIWAAAGEAGALQKWMQAVEEADGLGRLFDIDVIGADGIKLSRSMPRRCLICGESAQACGRSRRHPAHELYLRAQGIIRDHFARERASWIAACAQRALLQEALTAPKPGLVDRWDSGAHCDMDIFSFASSAVSLRDYFAACALAGMGEGAELEQLRFLGRCAEEDMIRATGGANTHKGAIFSLGILCCAAGMEGDILENAARIAAPALEELRGMSPEQAQTGGERQFVEHGLTGVRGEAAQGFPAVKNIALPALRRAIGAGKSLNDAGLDALLHLMACVDDSNVLRRRGMDVLRRVQAAARALLRKGYDCDALRSLNEDFIRENISPGGCADLLALTYFLYFIEKGDYV